MIPRNTAFIMVGLPASGKSTFIKKHLREESDRFTEIISSDYHLHQFALSLGISYNEAFETFIGAAYETSLARLRYFAPRKPWIIVDRTHLTPESRQSTVDIIKEVAPDNKIVFIVFEPNLAESEFRLNERTDQKVGFDILLEMYNKFVMPTDNEPWDELYVFDVWGKRISHISKLSEYNDLTESNL